VLPDCLAGPDSPLLPDTPLRGIQAAATTQERVKPSRTKPDCSAQTISGRLSVSMIQPLRLDLHLFPQKTRLIGLDHSPSTGTPTGGAKSATGGPAPGNAQFADRKARSILFFKMNEDAIFAGIRN